MIRLIFLLILGSHFNLFSQENGLHSGPMVGYSEMREVALWVQTTHSMDVKFAYWEKGLPETKTTTESKVTDKASAFAITLLADKVLPGKTYEYSLYLDNKELSFNYPLTFKTQPLWQWREDPPEFSFVAGSCLYFNEPEYDRPGKSYGGDYHILTSIDKVNPDFMLWLGDNTYFREADYSSKTGIYYRQTHTRSVKELQPLLGHVHHYAIWDDHDYGPNDADGSFQNKHLTLQAFKDFWPNPNYGFNGIDANVGRFQYNDCDFFLLDNRTFRTPLYDSGRSQILGKAQIDWLIAGLKSSRYTFKFVAVGGQFLNTAQVYENHSRYAEERAYLLQRIKEENIKNVVFLSGDRHHSEVNQLALNDDLFITEITSSPLTSSAHKKVKEENANLVDGSMIKERNFAQITLSGKSKKRQCEVVFFDSDGSKLYSYSIPFQGGK